MAVGDVWRVAVNGISNEQPLINVYYFRMISAASAVDQILGTLTANWLQLLAAAQSDQYQITLLQFRQLVVPPVGEDRNLLIVGSGGTGISDLRSSLVVKWTTATLGRSYRGRTFLPGFPASQLVGGVWNSATTSGIQTIADDWVANVGAGGANPDIVQGIWSRKLGDIPPPPGKPLTGYNLEAGFQPVTGAVVRTVGYTQRRRGFGVLI